MLNCAIIYKYVLHTFLDRAQVLEESGVFGLTGMEEKPRRNKLWHVFQ